MGRRGGPMAELEIHYQDDGDDWAALYVDGLLEQGTVGDSYLAEDKALELCGVKRVYDSAFMRGGNQREHAALTLDDIALYKRRMKGREQLIDKLLAEAEKLRERAEQLRNAT